MAKLKWVPSPINPRRGEFQLEGHPQSYWLSTGDGQTYGAAQPARQRHTYPSDIDAKFQVIARVKAAGEVMDTMIMDFTGGDDPKPQATVTQYGTRDYLDTPPYQLGNLELEVTNPDPGAAYTVDWGGAWSWPQPNRTTTRLAPGAVVRGNQPPGDYTATVTHVPSGKSTQVAYTVQEEAAVVFARGAGRRGVSAQLEALVALRDDEDPDLVSVMVDWGDDTPAHVWSPAQVGATATHTYPADGAYEAWIFRDYNGSGAATRHTITIPLAQKTTKE